MADGTTLPVGTGGDAVSTDELATLNGAAAPLVGGVAQKAQRVKVGFGDDGVFRDASKLFPMPVESQSATLCVSGAAASGVGVTVTLPAPAAGLFHYITSIDISLSAAAARVGAATPLLVTTTNLPGSPALNFPTAQAIGAIDRQDISLSCPIKASVAATATTIVCPIATSGIWRVNVWYYTAP
jgi:threonine aldolase